VRALTKDPAQRFASAAEFARELAAAAQRAGLEGGEKALAAAASRWAPHAPRSG